MTQQQILQPCQQDIEETKELVESVQFHLVQNYLTNHGSTVTNEFDREEWSERDYNKAINKANNLIKEAIKQLKY